MSFSSQTSLTLYCIEGRDVHCKEDVLALWQRNYNFLIDPKHGYDQTYTNRRDSIAKAMTTCGTKDPSCFVRFFYNNKKSFVILHFPSKTKEVIVRCSEKEVQLGDSIPVKITIDDYAEIIRYTVEPTNNQSLDPNWVKLRATAFCIQNNLPNFSFCYFTDKPKITLDFNPDDLSNVAHRVNLFHQLKKAYTTTHLLKEVGVDRV